MLGGSERANSQGQERAGGARGALTASPARRARRSRIDSSSSSTTNHVTTTAASMTLGCLCALLQPPQGGAWVSSSGGPGQRQQQSIASKRWGRRSRIGVQPLLRRHHGGGICSAAHRRIGYNGDGDCSYGDEGRESRRRSSRFVGARGGSFRRHVKGALSYKAMCMVSGSSSGSDGIDDRGGPLQDSESTSLRSVSSSSAAAVVAAASAHAPSPLADDNEDDARINDNGRAIPRANSFGADTGASVVQFTAVNGNNNSRVEAVAAAGSQPAPDTAAAAAVGTEADTPERQIEELGKKRRWSDVLKILESLNSPTREQYESAIMACSLSGQARHSLRIHAEMVAAGFEATPVSGSPLLMYNKEGRAGGGGIFGPFFSAMEVSW